MEKTTVIGFDFGVLQYANSLSRIRFHIQTSQVSSSFTVGKSSYFARTSMMKPAKVPTTFMAIENLWHFLTLVTRAKHPLTVHLSVTGECLL